MTLPAIGIIGMGFLGKEIARLDTWPQSSWGSDCDPSAPGLTHSPRINQFRLDLAKSENWRVIPDQAATLVLTAPPIYTDIEEEAARLRKWGHWMNTNRPQYRSLVYISSTGVYPNRDGHWDEYSIFEPDNLKGELRLCTEKILPSFFNTRVIRAGAIYGTGRNLGERIRSEKPIPGGEQPIHRIHVSDLARIVRLAVTQSEFPTPLNAVDNHPASSRTVVNWLIEQDFFQAATDQTVSFSGKLDNRRKRPPAKQRFISNHRLTEDCKFSLIHPTFKEGLPHCFTSENTDRI